MRLGYFVVTSRGTTLKGNVDIVQMTTIWQVFNRKAIFFWKWMYLFTTYYCVIFLSRLCYINRYELREDRKRESYHSANMLQSTKQEILSLIQEFNMTNHPRQIKAGQSQSIQNISLDRGRINDKGQVLSPSELEQLKEDVIVGICSKLHESLQTLQGVERLPSIDSDLYTTHLYTQL